MGLRFLVLLTAHLAVTVRGAQSQQIADFGKPTDIPRFALVLAAENYPHLDKVQNAISDAREIERALTSLGFIVRFVPNPTEDVLLDYVSELAARGGASEEPVIFLVFFVGHGFQNGAFNYIVPTNATPATLLDDGVPVSRLLDDLAKHQAGLTILLFDACRTGVSSQNAPITADQPRPIRYAPTAGRSGTVLGFAAGFGDAAHSAEAKDDRNSPYSMALMRYMPLQEISFADVLSQVKAWVWLYSRHTQEPFVLTSASIGNFQMAPTAAQITEDERLWAEVLATNRVDCIARYIMNRPGGRFVRSATRWLAAHPTAITDGGLDPCPDDPLYHR